MRSHFVAGRESHSGFSPPASTKSQPLSGPHGDTDGVDYRPDMLLFTLMKHGDVLPVFDRKTNTLRVGVIGTPTWI
jgi:hypothetical protein